MAPLEGSWPSVPGPIEVHENDQFFWLVPGLVGAAKPGAGANQREKSGK